MKKFDQKVRKRFYTQKSINDSIKVKKIFNSPNQFMKDLNLISKGINDSLKVFNRIQSKLLEDKKTLNILNKRSFEMENLESEFGENQSILKIKKISAINYNKYLIKQKNNLLSYDKRNTKRELLLNKIKYILNNIQIYGTQKLLRFLDNSRDEDKSEVKFNIILKYKNELDMLKIIENTIIFLQNSNNEYKEKGKDKYYEIEEKIKYLSHLNTFRKEREKVKNKREVELVRILEKNHNILFLPFKKNYYFSNRKGIKHKKIDNIIKINKSDLHIDFDY